MELILSIHDKHLKSILSGQKTTELRKTFPSDKRLNNFTLVEIYFYNTTTKQIECKTNAVIRCFEKGNIKRLEYLIKNSCVSKEDIEKYFENRPYYSYWQLRQVESIQPYPLPKGKKAPQSWCYYETIFRKS